VRHGHATSKYTLTGTYEWFTGGFFVVCRFQSSYSTGTTREAAAVFGYNQAEQAYTWYRYYSTGATDSAKGWVHGNTWVWILPESQISGKATRRQMTSTEESPTSWTYKWERSVEGEPWQTTEQGKCTKVK